MNKNRHFLVLLLTLFSIVSVTQIQQASALSLGVLTGLSFPGANLKDTTDGAGFLYGAEATLGTILDLGAFYERNNFKSKAVTSTPQLTYPIDFYGLLGRVNILSFFADAKLGVSSTKGSSASQYGVTLVTQDSDTAIGYGIGAGYKWTVAPFFALMPRLGYRSLPYKLGTATATQSTTDLTMIFAFLF